jgi:hypothetical protein
VHYDDGDIRHYNMAQKTYELITDRPNGAGAVAAGTKIDGADIKGAFHMYGTFLPGVNPTDAGQDSPAWLRTKAHESGLLLEMIPTTWTQEPPGGNWVMVGLEATPKPGNSAVLLTKMLVDGELEPKCKPFELRRVPSRSGGGVGSGSGSGGQQQVPSGLQYHSYKVRGAGTSIVNGEYLVNGTSTDGSPQYKHINEWAAVLPKHLYPLSPAAAQQKRVTLLHYPEIQASEQRTIPASWYLSDLGAEGVAGNGGDLDFYRQATSHAYPPTDSTADDTAGWSEEGGSGSAWRVDDGRSPGPLLRLALPEKGGMLDGEPNPKLDGRAVEISPGKVSQRLHVAIIDKIGT